MSGFRWTSQEVDLLKKGWPSFIETRTKKSCQIMAMRLGLTKKRDFSKDISEVRPCACGCGTKINRWQRNLREKFYVYGHQPRSKPESFVEYRRLAWSGHKNPAQKHSKTFPGKRVYPRAYEKIRSQILGNTNLCTVCGIKKVLNIHHKDGNPYNNNIENLVPVCRSCHSKIHTTNKLMAFLA